MATQEIRLNTVGIIGAGKYAGWYIFVSVNENPGYDTSYTVYFCTDTTFAFNPAERECYDTWAQNMPTLEGFLEDKFLEVRWDDSITPPKFVPSPEGQRLIERFEERMKQRKADKDKPSGDS